MKKKINEKPYIEEAIKQESSLEEHFKSSGSEWNSIRTTEIASFSAYYCNFATQTAHGFNNFQHPLVITYAVGNRKCNFGLMSLNRHAVKILNSGTFDKKLFVFPQITEIYADQSKYIREDQRDQREIL